MLAWRAVAVLSAVLACAGWAGLHFAVPGVLERIEERAGDLTWRFTASQQDERRIILVDIDERSLREIGPWPWPRETLARLTRQTAAQGASLQVFDLVLPEARSGDAALAAAIAATRPVLAQVFALEQGGEPHAGQLAGALDWPACPAPFAAARGYLANQAAFAAAAAGHITPRVSPDGAVRHQPAIICYDNLAYPALGIAALMQGAGAGQLGLERGSGWLDPPWRLTSALAPRGIPLDARGDLRLPWYQSGDSFVSVAAADVLAGRVPAGLMQNAWVLLGSTAFGLADTVPTPFGGMSAGLQVHAELLSALIDQRVPYTPRAAPLIQAALAFLGLALLVALSRLRLPAYSVPLAGLAWIGLLFALHAALQRGASLWLGWVDPALYTLLAALLLSSLEHARSRFERDRLYTHLASYLPAPVAAAIALQPPSSALTASKQNISVLFADIRNFSMYCEARPPEEAAGVLHAFFSEATRIVEAEGGMIEAFQGDAVIAVWNANPAGAQSHGGVPHSERALSAAVALLGAARQILPGSVPEGLEPLDIGIGIETGPAVVGSFGLARRRTHMALGRTITVASRLVEMTAELAHPILVGEGLAAQIESGRLESMGTFLLDGLKTPRHIYAYPLAPAAVGS